MLAVVGRVQDVDVVGRSGNTINSLPNEGNGVCAEERPLKPAHNLNSLNVDDDDSDGDDSDGDILPSSSPGRW